MANTPTGGTDIVSLGISVDATQPAEAAGALDKLGTATVKVVKNLDDFNSATEKNSKWVAEATQKYKNKIQIMEEQWRAEQAVIKAEREGVAVRASATAAAEGLIPKLEHLIAIYGRSREELLRMTAAELGMASAAEPLIAQLEKLKTATNLHGKSIKDNASIAAAEESSRTALNAQRIRSINDAAAAEESARTALDAQRRRSLAENQAAEESAAAALQAFKRRTLAENRAIAAAEIDRMEKDRLDAAAREQSNADALARFKRRTLAENQAERLRIVAEQEANAIKSAEKQAIEEIKWNAMSVRSRIAELERLRAYQAAPSIRPETIQASFSSAAIRDLPRLHEYHAELARSPGHHGKAREGVASFSEALKDMRWNARASTEVLVLAHEALDGRFTRMPGSMMVLGEYTGAASLAFSKFGIAILGVAAALGTLGYAVAKGIIEQKAMSDALIFTGNYAGQTAESLYELARAAAGTEGSMTAAKEAVTQLAASGRFTGDQIKFVSDAVVAMEHATGQSVDKTIKEFESLATQATGHTHGAAETISRALIALDDKYHFLTLAVYEQVRALEREGERREASATGMKDFADAIKQRTDESVANLGNIETAWKKIKHAIDFAKNAIIDWGKEDGPAQKVADAQVEKLKIEAELSALKSGPKDRLSGSREAEALGRLKKATDELTKAQNELNAANKKAEEQAAEALIQTEGVHASQELNAEKIRIQKREMGELNLAIQEYGVRLAKIAAANPKSPLLEQEAVNAGFAAIIKEHTPREGKIDKEPAALRKAELSDIKQDLDILTSSYRNAESILEANRSAGTLSEKEYYEAKLAFVRLNEDAVVSSLEKENDRLAQEKVSGKERIDILKQISENETKVAIAKADSASKQTVLLTQQEDSIKRLARAYQEARNASQAYLDTEKRGRQREIAAFSLGDRERRFVGGLNQIDDRYDDQRRDLETNKALLELEGKWTNEAQAQYVKRIALIDEFRGKSTKSWEKHYEDRKREEGNWINGAMRSLSNYSGEAADVAGQTESVFTRAFKGMEDAWVEFVMAGKTSFSDLTKSIIADMMRIQARQAISGMLTPESKGGGLGSMGAIGTTISAIGALAGGWGSWGVANAGIASQVGGFSALAASFDGGGFTGDAPRSGGIDGKGGFPAILHPQETVIDHTKSRQNVGNKVISLAPVYHFQIDARSDKEVVERIAFKMAQNANAQLRRDLERER